MRSACFFFKLDASRRYAFRDERSETGTSPGGFFSIGGVVLSLNIVSRHLLVGNSFLINIRANGEDVSPPLAWRDVPHPAKEFILIVDDPDATFGAERRSWRTVLA
jgi:hypothetical protein